MRSGTIVAIVVAIAVLVGGYFWLAGPSDRTGMEEQRTDRDAPVASEEVELVPEEEAAPAQQAAPETQEAEAPAAEDTTVDEDAAAVADDGPTVVGDEITDDTIVVQSETDEPTILDADDTTTSVEIVDDAERADSAVAVDAEAEAGDGESATESVGAEEGEADVPAETAATTEPEELLTPANFDRDEILTLIDDSEQLSTEQRSTLRALVEGASANPAMVEATINSIRTALDMASLN